MTGKVTLHCLIANPVSFDGGCSPVMKRDRFAVRRQSGQPKPIKRESELSGLGSNEGAAMCSVPQSLLVGILALGCVQDAFAQHRQLRPVTITFKATPDNKPVSVGDALKSTAQSPAGTGTTVQVAPSAGAQATSGMFPDRQGASAPTLAANVNPVTASRASRMQWPANPSMQTGISGFQAQAGSPDSRNVPVNNYSGFDHQYWSNHRGQQASGDLFESFNRFSVPPDSGSYYSPFSNGGSNEWSNLSHAMPTPNYLGSWNYYP